MFKLTFEAGFFDPARDAGFFEGGFAEAFDAGLVAALDGGLDAAFDGGFEAAFEGGLEAAFDAGFVCSERLCQLSTQRNLYD